MIRRKKLELVLEKISSHPKPKFWLEQYYNYHGQLVSHAEEKKIIILAKKNHKSHTKFFVTGAKLEETRA